MQFNIGDKVIFYKNDYTRDRFGFDDDGDMEKALNECLVLEVTDVHTDSDYVNCYHPNFFTDYTFDTRDIKLAEEEIKTKTPQHKTISEERVDDERLTLKELYDKYGQIKVAHESNPHVHTYSIIGPSVNFPDEMILEYPEGMAIRMYNHVDTMVPHQEPHKKLKDMKTFVEQLEYVRDKLKDTNLFSDEKQKVANIFMDLLDELEE